VLQSLAPQMRVQYKSSLAKTAFVLIDPRSIGCSLKIHRVENQRCWWKA